MTSTGKRIRAPVNFDMDGGMQMDKGHRMTSGDVMMKDDEDFISDLQSFGGCFVCLAWLVKCRWSLATHLLSPHPLPSSYNPSVGRVRHKVGEVALLRSTLNAKESELEDAKRYMQELEERNHHAQHKVNKLSRDVVGLEESNRALSFESKKKDEAVEELKRDVAAGKELLEQRTADVVRTRRELDEKQISIEALVSEKESLAKDHLEVQDRLQSRIESLAEVHGAMEKKFEDQQVAIISANEEKKKLEKHVRKVKEWREGRRKEHAKD